MMLRVKSPILLPVLAAVLQLLCVTPVPAAQTVGPVTDDLGVIRIPKGAPVQIGAYWVLSGPDTALGIDGRRGAEIAIKDFGGKILGHPIKFNVEDDQCSAEGGQTAATKLAANPQTVIVLGGACSSATTPAAPILWQSGITNVCNACSAPALTDANRKPGYDGFARTIASDKDQGASDAKYVFEVMKATKLATVHDGSPYAQQLAAVMAANFTKLGGKVVAQEAIAPTDVDMHPLLSDIAAAKPDVLYMPIFVAAAAQILRQSKDTPGLDHTTLIGGGSLAAPDFIEAAGPAVVGFRIGYPDVSADSMGKGYPDFLEKYKTMFGEAPISGYNANSYDAAMMALKAITAVAKTDSAGNLFIGKKALRDAVFASKFDGLSGPINCDAYGQCASFKPAVMEFTSADPKTFKIGTNPKKIWP
ncbi:branched-chain amino acid ABC transporter substrate-binding protein [Rhodopila sp.]|uniref:branched-chain amino acid ABC transporter substrate-binding protein n=1 Tax=Rhodopila sp. TaxID=2480087 RepID=UPI003D14D114